MIHTIYALCDPRTGIARYIGVTKKSLYIRLNGHLQDKKNCHRTSWIRHLLAKGCKPTIEPISLIDEQYRHDSERFWILFFRELGFHLVNSTDGGEGIPNPSEETRKKIGRNRRITQELREKLRKANLGNKNSLGRIVSVETRRKISIAQIGKVISEEQRAAISARQKGTKHSSGHKQKIRNSLLATYASCPRGPCFGTKISASRMGHPVSQSTKDKISAQLTGRRLTDSTRKKMRIRMIGNKYAMGNKNSLGRILSQESRAKISKALMGCQNARGHKCTDEARERMRISHLGKKPTPETLEKRRIALRLAWIKRKATSG
jgi:NUMOD3 motif